MKDSNHQDSIHSGQEGSGQGSRVNIGSKEGKVVRRITGVTGKMVEEALTAHLSTGICCEVLVDAVTDVPDYETDWT
jgi:hypothetical protein